MKGFLAKSARVCACILAVSGMVYGQTLSPPHAEYRNKADGLLTLTNNGNRPVAAILEVRGFTMDGNGDLRYTPVASWVHVKFGANSFIIPPHQSHYVFYKASCRRLPCWFAIMNTLTQAKLVSAGLRINVVLPHFVYIYQRGKLERGDVEIEAQRSRQPGKYRLKFGNRSEKLARVETIRATGFRHDATFGGFPLFPQQTRWLTLNVGTPTGKPRFKIRFDDGFRLAISPTLELASEAEAPGGSSKR